jgi:hypothetical protein
LFTTAARIGYDPAAKTDLFAFFIYHALPFMSPGARIGFVTSASWLTADFAAPLQAVLIKELRLVAVISSLVESFFSQVDINTTVIIAEKRNRKGYDGNELIRFVMLKKRISELVDAGSDYWRKMIEFADTVEAIQDHSDNEDYRVRAIPTNVEREALNADPRSPRNWSCYLRAPDSYFRIFGLN